ncbi:MAG: hypothetical protein HYV35_04600 [Lentisphaerae bacterium]|nr:hypothetical protein [Lentisphaerota bacterium]
MKSIGMGNSDPVANYGPLNPPNLRMKPMTIGTTTQFFLDDLFFLECDGMTLEMNPALKAGPVLKPEHAWEAYRIEPSAVLEDDGIYKMWTLGIARYEGVPGKVACPCCNKGNEGRQLLCRSCGWPLPGIEWVCRELYHKGFFTSADGIRWERPELGLMDYHGSRANNFFPFTGANCVAAINPAGSPAERFMAISSKGGKLYLSVSPDGIRWTMKPQPVLPFTADTNNQILYDPATRRYVALLRGFPNRRTIVRCEVESLDQTPWPFAARERKLDHTGCIYVTDELETALDIDAGDMPLPSLDINHLSATRYADGVWLGFPGLFRKYPGSVDRRGRETHRYFARGNDGVFETQLAVSRDGRTWSRPDRRPYVGNGLYGEPDGGLIMVVPGMIRRGDEVFQYYLGCRTTHGVFDPDGVQEGGTVFRLVQQKDRFIAATAGPRGGRFLTPLLWHDGKQLELNIDCQGLGEAFVQIRDAEGRPVGGFTREDCDPVDLNHLRHTVTWKGRSDLSFLAGTPVRLEFFMRSARLFTFAFAG